MSSEQQTILIVDDTPANIDVLGGILRGHYRIQAALSGPQALVLAQGPRRPDLILLDVMMPEMDGYEVLRRLKGDPVTAAVPVIFVTALADAEDEEKGLRLGAVDYLTKPITSAGIVLARIRTHLALHQQHRELARLVDEQTAELIETRHEIIRRLGLAAEFRDNETGLHVVRMSHYARIVALGLGTEENWANCLLNAAPMHDIGKIGIPDGILLKRGKLDADEWQVMRRHPEIGAAIIGDHPDPLMRMARQIALCHHEKFDGTGYPRGLKGEEIPLEARIATLVDVFDALTTARPYKKAWPVFDTLAFLEAHSGAHFDPALVRIFMRDIDKVMQVHDVYRDEAEQTPDGLDAAESALIAL